MGKKRLISVICLMAFAMVFAHSVIPHCHCEHHEHMGHFHGPGNCELIDTYIISDSDEIPQQEIISVDLFPAEAILCDIPEEGGRISFDLSDKFPERSASGKPCRGLRAPPAV